MPDSWNAPSALDRDDPSAKLAEYLVAGREYAWIIALAVVLTTAIAALYVVVAPKVYEAEAMLLVSPIPSSDTELIGLGLIRESNDPTRDVETVATLVTTPAVAERVSTRVPGSGTPEVLVERVRAVPIAQSNLVAITTEASSPDMAARLANGFAAAVVLDRTARFHEQVEGLIEEYRARLSVTASDRDAASSSAIREQLTRFELLAARPDPTVRVETAATEPTDPVKPRTSLSIIAGVLAGALLGIGAAFVASALDPFVRREEQVRDMLPAVPVLARIPRNRRPATPGALTLAQLAPGTADAYWSLRMTLGALKPERSWAILTTGASVGDGSTTTALVVAQLLAQAGNGVILVDADMRTRSASAALAADAENGDLGDVLTGRLNVEDALTPVPGFARFWILPAPDRPSDLAADYASDAAVAVVLDRARTLAEYVIVDAAPFTDTLDALPFARGVDDVLLVVRARRTLLTDVRRVREVLAQVGPMPLGIVFVRAQRSARRRGERVDRPPVVSRVRDEPAREPAPQRGSARFSRRAG